MDDGKWERWGALGGILFAILATTAALLPGSPPSTDDPTAKMVKFFVDNGNQIRYAGYLGALAVVPLFWWLASLWRLLRRAESGSPRLAVATVLGGAYASTIGAVAGIVLAAVPIIGVDDLGPAGTRAWYIVATNVGFSGLFGVAVLIGATSVVFVRSRVMPAVLGWFGILVALVALVGGATTVSTRDVLVGVALAAYIGATVWVLVTSIIMLSRAPQPAAATA